MGAATAIKISAELAESARAEAEHSDRSLTGQIEHWAKLGKAAEGVLPTIVVSALKRSGGDLDSLEDPELKERVLAALGQLRLLPVAELQRRMGLGQEVRYEPDPAVPGGMIRIAPDGTRTAGTMKGRTFVPNRT